jgi:hypothetical protein
MKEIKVESIESLFICRYSWISKNRMNNKTQDPRQQWKHREVQRNYFETQIFSFALYTKYTEDTEKIEHKRSKRQHYNSCFLTSFLYFFSFIIISFLLNDDAMMIKALFYALMLPLEIYLFALITFRWCCLLFISLLLHPTSI